MEALLCYPSKFFDPSIFSKMLCSAFIGSLEAKTGWFSINFLQDLIAEVDSEKAKNLRKNDFWMDS